MRVFRFVSARGGRGSRPDVLRRAAGGRGVRRARGVAETAELREVLPARFCPIPHRRALTGKPRIRCARDDQLPHLDRKAEERRGPRRRVVLARARGASREAQHGLQHGVGKSPVVQEVGGDLPVVRPERLLLRVEPVALARARALGEHLRVGLGMEARHRELPHVAEEPERERVVLVAGPEAPRERFGRGRRREREEPVAPVVEPAAQVLRRTRHEVEPERDAADDRGVEIRGGGRGGGPRGGSGRPRRVRELQEAARKDRVRAHALEDRRARGVALAREPEQREAEARRGRQPLGEAQLLEGPPRESRRDRVARLHRDPAARRFRRRGPGCLEPPRP